MSLWTHLAAFWAGGTLGVVLMALLAAHGAREKRAEREVEHVPVEVES